jgi:hypothetical protein
MLHVTASQLDDSLLPPEVERAVRDFIDNWEGTVDPVADDLVEAVRSETIDLGTTQSIRADIKQRLGNFTQDFEVLFREHTENAVQAGRAVAGRRFSLDVSFDRVPRRTLRQLDDWPATLSETVSDTLADDVSSYLRGAHEEGLSVDKIADQFQDEFVDGRIKNWKAEQLARDTTIPPSNAGSHSAFQDADSVVGEEWLATGDSRTRDTHLEADGQVTAVDTPFLVGGHTARYPGDPRLPIEESTQCRCTTVPVFADELSDGQLATIRAGGRVWV